MGCIYCITNKVNGKRYVGQTIGIAAVRWRGHKSSANRPIPKTKIAYAIRKHGLDSFEFSVVESSNDIGYLNERERFWISEYDTVKNGYNIERGGKNGIRIEIPSDIVARLGTCADYKLARIIGVSHHTIEKVREGLGIPKWQRGLQWTEEMISDLSVLTQKQMAQKYGISHGAVYNKTVEIGVRSPYPHPTKGWEKRKALLGVVPVERGPLAS